MKCLVFVSRDHRNGTQHFRRYIYVKLINQQLRAFNPIESNYTFASSYTIMYMIFSAGAQRVKTYTRKSAS